MAALTKRQLIDQVRVLMGDAFPGSPRYSDEKIERALQWAQSQCCRKLGLSYREAHLAVIDKVVLTPVDCMGIQHVRIGEPLVTPLFEMFFAIPGDNGNDPCDTIVTWPWAGSWDLALVVRRLGGHTANIMVSPVDGPPDSNLVLTFNGSNSYSAGDPVITLSGADTEFIIPCPCSNGAEVYSEYTFTIHAEDAIGNIVEASLLFLPQAP